MRVILEDKGPDILAVIVLVILGIFLYLIHTGA